LPGCDAAQVVGDRVRFWSVLAEDQQRGVTLDVHAEPVLVRSGAEELAVAVDALLENIFTHTREGTAFSVRLTAQPDGALLEISTREAALPSRSRREAAATGAPAASGWTSPGRCAEAAGGLLAASPSASGGALITLTLKAR
jgi:hypothetical protein